MPGKKSKRLQVQISEELFNDVSQKSDELGIDSVNQLVKMMLQGFANNSINFGFYTKQNSEFIEQADENLRASILEAMREIEAGDYVEVDMNDCDARKNLKRIWSS